MNAVAGTGRPVRFFVLILLGWVALRLVTWTDPWPVEAPLLAAKAQVPPARAQTQLPGPRAPVPTYVPGQPLPLLEKPAAAIPTAMPPEYAAPIERPLFVSGRTAAGFNMLWMAGMAALPMPQAVADVLDRGAPSSATALPPAGIGGLAPRLARAERWRFDGWVQWRADGRSGLGAVQQGSSLGGTQAGGILAFRLSDVGHDRFGFLRLSASPAQADQPHRSELAAGLRWRPIAGVPVQAQAELRAIREGGRLRLAPAALAVGGVDDAPLGHGLRLRAYGAAGWVGGRYATGFVEGQAVAAREVANFDLGRVSAGVGAWGSAQRDASRLDIGPSLAAAMPVGETEARLQLDYRVKIAGNAAPRSGPALTLSTGF